MTRVRWSALTLIALILAFTIGQIGVAGQATPVATPAAVPVVSPAVQAGADWIARQQLDDGGWPGNSGTSDVGITIDAVLALAAARNAGATVDLDAAEEYLNAHGRPYAEASTGGAARLTMAVVALGADPRDFARIDPFKVATDDYNVDTKLYGDSLYDSALVMLAYAAVGRTGPDRIEKSFKRYQIEDGSWAYDATEVLGNGDTNTTALVVQSLIATGRYNSPLIPPAMAYLRSTLQEGGFPFQWGDLATADGKSTGLAVQALIATGVDISSDEWMNVGASVGAFQNADGSFSYMLDPRDSNLLASVQLLPALAGQAFPILPQDIFEDRVALPTCMPEELATPVAVTKASCAA